MAVTGAVDLASLAGCIGSSSNGGGGSEVPLIITHDMVVSAATVRKNQAPCSLENRYLHGQRVIFRIRVIDPETGEKLDDSSLKGVSVKIEKGDGQTVDGYYSKHPPENPTDYYWVVPWTVPEEFPAGPVDYDIIVNAERSAKSYRFDVPPANLTVLNGSYAPDKSG
ncbi:MAG TPA: hypothetical protein VFJ06_08455 [Halococcus sp.]|nr:hypothetical protein [Halococcus sp.]